MNETSEVVLLKEKMMIEPEVGMGVTESVGTAEYYYDSELPLPFI